MRIFLTNHSYRFDVEQTALTLMAAASPRAEEGPLPKELAEPFGASSVRISEKSVSSTFLLVWEGLRTEKTCRTLFHPQDDAETRETKTRHTVRRAAYLAITAATGEIPAWGALSGVRPAKLAGKLLQQHSPAKARQILIRRFFVLPEKADLAVSLAQLTQKIAAGFSEKEAIFYIGIPFCPSRCAYCSFGGGIAAEGSPLVEAYLRRLCAEIETSGHALAQGGASLAAVYAGGGTPTVLSAAQLERLLQTVKTWLPLAENCEITVEAGRPDTITAEKIQVMSRFGVNRVSVNPQSFSDSVLAKAKRLHTAEEAVEAFHLVRKEAPEMRINMDFIAGLPGDLPETFQKTLETAISLAPDNITVHTLALKKGAAWAQQGAHTAPEILAAMLRQGQKQLAEAGYLPYYLYRQKYMGGSFENIGYAKENAVCLYNIAMMEEILPVAGSGAGAVTKLVAGEGRFRRIANPKFAADYGGRIEEILAGKTELTTFFAEKTGKTPLE